MNAMWRWGPRHGVAYIESRDLALHLIRDGVTRHRTLTDAMAVYRTSGGRAFAWQLLIANDCWEDVARTLGESEVVEAGDASEAAAFAVTEESGATPVRPPQAKSTRSEAKPPVAKRASRPPRARRAA